MVQSTNVVKGGVGKAWHIDTFNENGVTITGTSANSEPGKTIAELSAGIHNSQIRTSTVERIQQAGGAVIPTRRFAANPFHVTVTGLTLQQLDAVFDPPMRNPSRP